MHISIQTFYQRHLVAELLLAGAFLLLLILCSPALVRGQSENENPFAQIDDLLPSPNSVRLASGAPGPDYWQQKVDYKIDVSIDEPRKMLRGSASIHYENHSPHPLPYLWLHLDANRFTPHADGRLTDSESIGSELDIEKLQRLLTATEFDGGVKLLRVQNADKKDLSHQVVKGMLRIDLPTPLQPGQTTDFEIDWEYRINNSKLTPGRTGYEPFDDGNAVFCIAQWFPRLCAYTDYGGWRHKQFIGAGEFTVEFGNYDVRISVPSDHTLFATGSLINLDEALSSAQQQRLEQAYNSRTPVYVVAPEEAKQISQQQPADDLKTWHFQAENVRDFAFASSRKFIWDACIQEVGKRKVLCMSLYPPEGQPLWNQYSTQAVAHAVDVYSRFTGIEYPYPHATSVMGVVGGGMEYPMICFNGPRPEKDGSYSEQAKKRLIGVVIHEVGHNWFPMIINTDERHWMWLDEGLNTFVQSIAQRAWEDDEEHTSAQPRAVIDYLKRSRQRPIMTAPDALFDVGNNAYRKTSTGLTILRETILGRELFDFAFQQYCRRWAFKRPEPADLFRTMEDASGIDLDWFWRGWFYGTGNCDMEVASVIKKNLHDTNPAEEQARHNRQQAKTPPQISREREAELTRRVDQFPELNDFYSEYNPHATTPEKQKTYEKFLQRLTPEEKELLQHKLHIYEVKFRRSGELVMPLIVELQLGDGTKKLERFPAEVWQTNPNEFSRIFFTEQPLIAVQLDPYLETTDTDTTNNRFPREIADETVPLKKPEQKINNPLQQHLKKKQAAEKKE